MELGCKLLAHVSLTVLLMVGKTQYCKFHCRCISLSKKDPFCVWLFLLKVQQGFLCVFHYRQLCRKMGKQVYVLHCKCFWTGNLVLEFRFTQCQHLNYSGNFKINISPHIAQLKLGFVVWYNCVVFWHVNYTEIQNKIRRFIITNNGKKDNKNI